VAGSTLLALAADHPLQGAAAREARELMRQVLAHHLGGRPLKSRELFRRYRPKGQ
jgi:DNA repair protein RecO (recombination protein O)